MKNSISPESSKVQVDAKPSEMKHFETFCEETSLHGWSYLNNKMNKIWNVFEGCLISLRLHLQHQSSKIWENIPIYGIIQAYVFLAMTLMCFFMFIY
jgi:hypothetical protein